MSFNERLAIFSFVLCHWSLVPLRFHKGQWTNNRGPILFLGSLLAELALDDLILIAQALALVGLHRTAPAHIGGEVTQRLFVMTAQRDPGRQETVFRSRSTRCDFHSYSFRQRDIHR